MLKSVCKITCVLVCASSLSAFSIPTFDLSKLGNSFDVGGLMNNISNVGSKFGNNIKIPQLNLGADIGGINGGALGSILQNGVVNSATGFGDDFFKGKCSVSIPNMSGVGSNLGDVCDMLTGAVGNALAPFEKLIQNGLDFGVCQVGADINSKCALEWTKKQCQKAKETAKDVATKARDIARKGWEDSGASGLVAEAREKVSELYSNTKQNISELGKKFKTAVALDEGLKQKLKGNCSDGEDDIMNTPMGGDNTMTLGETLNSEAFAYATITSPKNGGSSMASKVIFNCIQSLPKEKGLYDFLTPDGKGGYKEDSEKLQTAIKLCSPAEMSLGNASDIFKRTVDLAKDMSQDTNINFVNSVALSGSLKEELANNCVVNGNFADAKMCEQKLLSSANTNENSTAHKMNVLEKENIRKIEDQSSKFLALLEEVYPNELKDTSDASLKKILPSQRAYFIHQAKKQEMKDAMIISFAKKIEKSKKELARISMVKIKECSTPFYYASAVQEVADTISNARKEAQDTVNKILDTSNFSVSGGGGSGGFGF